MRKIPATTGVVVSLVDSQIRKKSLLTGSSAAGHRAPQFQSLFRHDEAACLKESLKLVAIKAAISGEASGFIPEAG